MRIGNRPRSSSVAREIEMSQFNYYRGKGTTCKDNENRNDNEFNKEYSTKNLHTNTQRRQLRPPNFQVSYNIGNISQNISEKLSSNQSKDKDLNESLTIKKAKKSSITRRSHSETRQKKEFNSNRNQFANEDSNFNRKNKNDINKSHSALKIHDDISSNGSLKMPLRSNEFKNFDGSIKKLSEKFRCLAKKSIDNDDDFIYQSALTSRFQNSISSISEEHSINYPLSSIETTGSHEINESNDSYFFDKTGKSTFNNNSFQTLSQKKDQNENKSSINEKMYDSIQLAMNRIKKEIDQKEILPIGVKPAISKRKKLFLNGKEQTSKSIDFEFLKDVPCFKEQNNKSNAEKPHVSFMNTFQPPKKKNNDIRTNSNDAKQLSDELIDLPKPDYAKKIDILSIKSRSKKELQKLPQSQDIDEFIQMEKKMKEEVDDDRGDVIPNFLKIIKILRDQLDKNQYQEVIRIMNKNKSKHFLLLLTRPLMNIDAVYLMRGDLKFASLLWGFGPEKMTKEMIDQFWKYNVTTKLFDDQQIYNFEPNLDAISIIKYL